MRIVVMGPPGGGKGTLAHQIHARYGAPMIEVGAMLREEAEKSTPFGKKIKGVMDSGELLPDDLVLEFVYKKVSLCKNGFISDGFPRTVYEAEMFDQFLEEQNQPLHCALYLHVDEEEILHRVAGRLICSNCGKIYHKETNPPKMLGICDTCGKALETRSDSDTEDKIKHRLAVYHHETEPVLSYYKTQGKLQQIDGNKSIKEVAQEALIVLEQFRKA